MERSGVKATMAVSLRLAVEPGDGRVTATLTATSRSVRMREHVAGDASFLELLFDHDQVRVHCYSSVCGHLIMNALLVSPQ